MRSLSAIRRILVTLAAAAVVAGCLTPSESTGPTDLDRDKDNNGLPDDEERNLTNTTEAAPDDADGTPGAASPIPGLPSDPYA